ncbi:MAG TPA: sialate O-acetylesterase [Cytophagaceae bacterium]|jgi:sialate O-acetylesterase
MKINNYLSIFILLTTSKITLAEVTIPSFISNNMVLQRDTELKIWGWASNEETVTVIFNGITRQADADQNHEWIVTFPPMQADGSLEMIIEGENRIVLNEILLGDVYMCSGQSNMEWSLGRCGDRYNEEYDSTSNYTQIRILKVIGTSLQQPNNKVETSSWVIPNKENAHNFSAVAYFFAKELYNKYNVPIGLILNTWGGSSAELWMSSQSLSEFPEISDEFKKVTLGNADRSAQTYKDQITRAKDLDKWIEEAKKLDEGFQDSTSRWKELTLDISEWTPIEVPGNWEDYGLKNVDGLVWFRQEFLLPDSLATQDLKIELGYIEDMDEVWINGILVGSTSEYEVRRVYNIPVGVCKPGRNVIAVRVVDHGWGGGIKGDVKIKSKNYVLAISKKWYYKIGYNFKNMTKFIGPDFYYNTNWSPSSLYNGMIYPFLNYKIKGVLWYQGEANVGRAKQYEKLFPRLILDWRNNWNMGSFPFLYVQLANYCENPDANKITQIQWAALREAQTKGLILPNTGMVTAIDIGEKNNIHPTNKKEVGKRLALLAMKLVYKDTLIIAHSPVFERMTIDRTKIKMYFKNSGSSLLVKDNGYIKNFVVAGRDKKFYPTTAYLANNVVIVTCPKQVKRPVAVRYSWTDYPEPSNFYNKEGLPVLPFRTDNWEISSGY